MKRQMLGLAIMLTALSGTLRGEEIKVPVLPGEGWWGGMTTLGTQAPFGLNAKAVRFDIRTDNGGNQAVPLMLSTKGRAVWSDKAFACSLTNGVLTFAGEAPIELTEEGGDLRSAFRAMSRRHFPASGKTPDLALIEKPQWNTWIELTYNQNQKDILAYAKAIKANGFPEGGVIMIDDTWQHGYGVWDFDARRFSDPKAMCDELHQGGYKIMLWVCPFVSMDSPGYREMVFGVRDSGRRCEKGGLIMQADRPDVAKPVDWWNGRSAILDLTHPLGAKWFARELKCLQDVYGVDGFKLDAGDMDEYVAPYVTHEKASPSDLCEAYAKIGLEFPLNEYRACYKMGGQPLVQRLCDKGHSWKAVRQLVPDMIACGLLGHPFVCPDMIGGGSWMAFAPGHTCDAEIFVRSAQAHALAPMMQFSAAPWRVLKGESLEAVRAAAWLRMKWTPYIVETAKECAKTGEPILRAMEYEFPGQGAETVTDQFMLGSKLLVAPQTAKGAKTRTVFIPAGTWTADDGTVVTGPKTVEVATPLARLPHFVRADPSVAAQCQVQLEKIKKARKAENYREAAVPPYELADPLTFADGTKLKDASEWPRRRAEIVKIFSEQMYGQPPPKPAVMELETLEEGMTLGGTAVRKQVRMWFSKERKGPKIDWLLLWPKQAKGPVPFFAMLNYDGNHEFLPDREIVLCSGWHREDDATWKAKAEKSRNLQRQPGRAGTFPIEKILARGYGFVTACYRDVAPDTDAREGDDMINLPWTQCFALWGGCDRTKPDAPGVFSAWAWALSRGLDLCEREKAFDSTRAVAIGCSRLAKTALLAASRDERFKVVVPNQCGGGGVKLQKRFFGESVQMLYAKFPHWLCPGYERYAGKESELPFDQHLLVASIAPRRILVEGFNSPKFDARGEYLSVRAASPVWTFLGLEGLPDKPFPPNLDTGCIGPYVGYARHDGDHGISDDDWRWALDFCDKAFRK